MDEIDPTLSHGANMVAGAAAGVMEHIAMFPIDTIKTRLQSVHVGATSKEYHGVLNVLQTILRTEGVAPLFRGIGAAAIGAAPAHAIYFAAYEWTKDKISPHMPLAMATSVSGIVATISSDAIMTPWDVVKQRLQMENTPYRGTMDCIKQVIKIEGVGAFFISYPATVVMNIPFVAAHFTTYEHMYPVFASMIKDDSEQGTSPISHLLAGGVAGGVAAAVSNPLDVAKTRLQTQIGDEKKCADSHTFHYSFIHSFIQSFRQQTN
eukprot:TRINITY_DN4799_c0_g1_i1.p1 TRINITY_DN4799_c0_g1~~TRINITY_DN4799_c0_g1_i1.p1  ORF type:complete len:264 (+),score=63.80 TRINITY_DN4799_c0_g1_i1:630-1421(+)